MAVLQVLEAARIPLSIGEIYAIIESIIILIVTIAVALVTRHSMRRSLLPKLPIHIYKPFENIVFYSIIFGGVILALRPFGLNLSSLLVAGGLASIVVGLAAQNTLGDVISGIFLLIEQPLRVGDPIMVEGITGEVIDVRVISTLVRTWDGHLVRIPNRTIFDSIITNFGRTKARRIDFIVGVHYDSDIDRTIEAIRKFIDESPYCLLAPEPEVYVDNYGDSSINIRIRCWTPTQLWYPAKMHIQTDLKKKLDEEGIKIPYPQLDLHIIDARMPLPVKVEKE